MDKDFISPNIKEVTELQEDGSNSGLLKKLIGLELEGKKESEIYYEYLKQFFGELRLKDAKSIEIPNLEKITNKKKELGIDINEDILLYGKVDSREVIVLVEYKRILSKNFIVRMIDRRLFLGEKIGWKKEEVDPVIKLCLERKLDRENIEEFKRKRSGDQGTSKSGFWLHKDGDGVGQTLNYYLIYQYLNDLLGLELMIFAILTNGIEWILFNYSLEEIAEIFSNGFSEETVKRDKINFFGISELNSLAKAIESLARGNFCKREESKKVYILP